MFIGLHSHTVFLEEHQKIKKFYPVLFFFLNHNTGHAPCYTALGQSVFSISNQQALFLLQVSAYCSRLRQSNVIWATMSEKLF